MTIGYLVTGLGIGLFRLVTRRGEDGDDDGDEVFPIAPPSRN